VLRVDRLTVAYGSVVALDALSLAIEVGEIVALVGANGAGKTTTLAAISGLVKPRAGEIKYFGDSIVGHSVEDIVGLGIGHSPEGRRVFPGLTVEENLLMGASSWRRFGQSVADDRDKVYTLFPRLKERRRQLAWSLSGGEQQMLAIGRGLMAKPKLLLLDEPSMGLAPKFVEQILENIRAINETGVTVLLVEQNAAMALAISHRGYVLETGEVILEGTASELAGNDLVRQAYLGG
jgi:branched-chain amino acid transport system ATP-binding protein